MLAREIRELAGDNSKIFGIFTPKMGEIFDDHIFQMGWNHQLVKGLFVRSGFPGHLKNVEQIVTLVTWRGNSHSGGVVNVNPTEEKKRGRIGSTKKRSGVPYFLLKYCLFHDGVLILWFIIDIIITI